MKHQSGFNLIELLIVMIVAAIMLGIGVPSFRQFTASQKVKNAAFDFAAAMLMARSEAIKRNAPVTVAQSGADWSAGWTVTVAGNTLASQTPTTNVTITPNPSASSLAFQGNGRVTSTVRFQFGAANTDAVRCVTVSVTGLPSTTTASCS